MCELGKSEKKIIYMACVVWKFVFEGCGWKSMVSGDRRWEKSIIYLCDLILGWGNRTSGRNDQFIRSKFIRGKLLEVKKYS